MLCFTAFTAVWPRAVCRGQEQSRKADDIKREMLALGEAGYKEVTLLGQNIDAYGRWGQVGEGLEQVAQCERVGAMQDEGQGRGSD